MQNGLLGFLKHDVSLARFERLYTLQILFTQFSNGWELKSPWNKILS